MYVKLSFKSNNGQLIANRCSSHINSMTVNHLFANIILNSSLTTYVTGFVNLNRIATYLKSD